MVLSSPPVAEVVAAFDRTQEFRTDNYPSHGVKVQNAFKAFLDFCGMEVEVWGENEAS